jgi:hypothetical protein
MTAAGWLDTKDAARLIRKDLKRAFPSTTFRVRISRYSGGSSIDVTWTDGPTRALVKPITDYYQGHDFDGMQDLQTSRDPITVEGQQVRTGCYVFEHRELSDALVARVIAALGDYYHAPEHRRPTVADYRAGKVWNRSPLIDGRTGEPCTERHWSWEELIRRAAEDRTECHREEI